MNGTHDSSLQLTNIKSCVEQNGFAIKLRKSFKTGYVRSRRKYSNANEEDFRVKFTLIKDTIFNLRKSLEFYKKLLEKYLKFYSTVLFWVKVINNFLSSEVTMNFKLCKISKKIPRRILSSEYENYQVLLDDISMKTQLMTLLENEYEDIKDLIQVIATFLNVREYDIFCSFSIRESSFTELINYILWNMNILNMLESRICKYIDELIGLSEVIMSPDANNLLTELRVFVSEDLRVKLKVFTFDSGKVICEIKQYDERNCNVELAKEINNLEKIFNEKKIKNNCFNRFFGLSLSGKKLKIRDFIKEISRIENEIKKVENESNNQKGCLSQVSNAGESVKSCDSLLKTIDNFSDLVIRQSILQNFLRGGIKSFHNSSEDEYVDMNSITQCRVDTHSITQCRI